jgi:hypothetical protein
MAEFEKASDILNFIKRENTDVGGWAGGSSAPRQIHNYCVNSRLLAANLLHTVSPN